MTAGQDLDAFLIRREQILIGSQPLALPKAGVQVQRSRRPCSQTQDHAGKASK